MRDGAAFADLPADLLKPLVRGVNSTSSVSDVDVDGLSVPADAALTP